MKQAVVLALLWSLIPLLPAILEGDIAGSPSTDLYPSVWSLWAISDWLQQGFRLSVLGHPNGSSWYPNSLLLGLLAQPFLLLLSAAQSYNLLLLLSRFATALSFYAAGKALNLKHNGSMWLMVLVGCSPFLQGFAVEGILEGTTAWALGGWLWCVGKHHRGWSIFFFALCILSNWYYGAVACLLCLILGWKDKGIWYSFLGIGLCLPFIWLFLNSASGPIDIPSQVRSQMGFRWQIPLPHFLTDATPFAITTYIGWIPLLLLAHLRKRASLWILVPLGLSQGWPFLYDLPVLELLRFPYRWHLATLVLIGLIIGRSNAVQKLPWLPYVLLLENLVLSPIPLLLPTSPSQFPAYTTLIDGPVLELPGPLSRPPGQINMSRPRNKYILYHQIQHQQPSAWTLDFNGLQSQSSCFAETRVVDPHSSPEEQAETGSISCWEQVKWVVIHNTRSDLDALLAERGFERMGTENVPVLWKRIPP